MIADKLAQVNERIASACAAAGRPVQSVTLLAVSKTFGVDSIAAAHAAGQRRFGENYVQEAVEKIAALAALEPPAEWHLIGPLQSNKTRVVAESFDWVHSVDRLKVAERLSAHRPARLEPLSVCLQVNISGAASKSGLAPAEVPALARAVAALPRLRLRGLMAIPEVGADREAQRRPHRALHALFEALRRDGLAVDTISAGMSGDLEAAILEGATMVRVGTAIFGGRAAAEP
jgi:pyridoxal phosphate enzyme (YggS family)